MAGKIRTGLVIGGFSLLVAVAGAVVYRYIASATVSPVDWTAGTPTTTKIADLPRDIYGTNLECTDTSLQVYRSITSIQNETRCMVPTAMGLADINGEVVQPNGYNKAYPLVKYLTGGNPVFIPIRNQAAALEMRGYPTGPGVSYQLYKHIYTHMKFEVVFEGPRFKLVDPPEEKFTYGDGRAMQFNPFTLATSNNGRYLIVDTIFNGFMRVDLLNLNRQPFAESLIRDSSDGLFRAATAIDDGGKFAAIAYGAPGGWGTPYFKLVNIGACTGNFNTISSVPPKFNCPTIEMRPMLEKAIPNLFEIKNVRFANDRTITFFASTRDATGVRKYANYSMTASGHKASLVSYLALGDSYISGEGAYSYREGTDTERNRCHQSTLSYPYLLGANIASFASVACSGARSQHIQKTANENTFQTYGSPPNESELKSALNLHTPGLNPQSAFVDQDNPEAITISIGGNDIGFSDILTKCVHPFQGLKENLVTHHTCYPTYEDRLELMNAINDRLPKLRELYAGLKSSGTGTRRVYVIGYPQIAKVGGDCGLNVQMNADEVKLAHDLIVYLNKVIRQAANEAGVVYVDTQATFDGYRLCEGNGANSAMNGFTVSKTSWGSIGVAESFHPNKSGHEKLAQTVADQTSNLTRLMPEPVAVSPPPAAGPGEPLLQNAPVTGRTVRKVQLLERGEPIVQKGSQLDLVVNAQSYYTKPNTVYDVVMQSTPINMGKFTSDAQGNLNISATIPAVAEPGFHTVHIYGNDIFGNPIDLQRVIYVAASGEDYDSDGVPNGIDSCALAAQSGIDMDVDDIDDACDPLVTEPPVLPPEPEGIIWRDDTVLTLEIQAISGE